MSVEGYPCLGCGELALYRHRIRASVAGRARWPRIEVTACNACNAWFYRVDGGPAVRHENTEEHMSKMNPFAALFLGRVMGCENPEPEKGWHRGEPMEGD